MKLNMIAQRLNLSESTVSRALNDYQDIATETKALVRKTAAELGYVPNMHARRLASGNADTIAYVMPRTDGQLNASFLGELMTGMAEALTSRGWDLSVLVPRSLEEELETYRNISRTRHVSGLIISRTLTKDVRFQLLKDLNIPFVAHGRSLDSEHAAWIDVDNAAAFADMTAHFFALGHRRIAHIGGPDTYNFAVQRARGWRAALEDNGISPASDLHEVADLSFNGGAAAMERLLALDDPPTAVCCISDVVAIGAMRTLRAYGLVPGQEVSVIGYDGLDIGAWLEPPLSTMKQPLQSAGQQLVDIVTSMVEKGDAPADHQKLYRATLVRRGTDNPPSADWPARSRSKIRPIINKPTGGIGL